MKDKNVISMVTEYSRRTGFYQWRGIKYFLYEYEMHLKSKTKTKRNKIDWNTFIEDDSDHITIEHIYPQKAMRKCWTDKFNKYNSKERTILRHSLGNLVPLSRPKNSSLQNKCFKDKLGDETNKVGFRYGSLSEIEISCKEDWTPLDILNRGVLLLDFMEERWGFEIGDEKDKVKFLSLEFVYQKEIAKKIKPK